MYNKLIDLIIASLILLLFIAPLATKAYHCNRCPMAPRGSALMNIKNNENNQPLIGQQRSLIEEKEVYLMSLISNTENGVAASAKTREEVRSITTELSEAAARDDDGVIPLKDPRLYGLYNVSFVSSGSSQRGNPAGGNFRSKFGQLLYRNKGLYQHILRDESSPAATVVSQQLLNEYVFVRYVYFRFKG